MGCGGPGCTACVAPESPDASGAVSGSVRRSPSTSGTAASLPRGSTPKCTISAWGWKNQKSKKTKKKLQECGGRKESGYFAPFFARLCESLLLFINDSGSRKPSVQRGTEQLERLAPRAPKRCRKAMERGKLERAVPLSRSGLLCRRECGTAELAGGRRGVAVCEQGSGAVTFFFFCFK